MKNKKKKIPNIMNYKLDRIEQAILDGGGTLLILEKLDDNEYFLQPFRKLTEEDEISSKKGPDEK